MAYYPAARVVNLPAALADRRLPPESRADFARIHRRIAGYLDMRGARSAGLTVAE